jgi:hypothetical protein
MKGPIALTLIVFAGPPRVWALDVNKGGVQYDDSRRGV